MYEIIDAHAHIFPLKIAEKATDAIGRFYGISMSASVGTSGLLLQEGAKAGISRFVVHSTATTVRQVENINKYIISEKNAHPEFIGFMTLHPDMEEDAVAAQIDYCIANGIKGIKLHPDFQQFAIDEERAGKIYRQAEGRLPILFHTGDKRYQYSNPLLLARVAKEYPDLTVIGAHFGGYGEWSDVYCYKGLKNIYFDTSSTLAFLTPDEAARLIEHFGPEWFFFGTDFPMWNPSEELRRFLYLPLSEEYRTMILSRNFKRVFGLD